MNDILLPQVLIDAVNEELAKNKSGWDPKVRPIKMHDLITKRSWYGDEPTVVKTGDTIPLNWSHEASEKLGKFKKVDICDDIVSIEHLCTASGREWIDKLIDYIFEEENRYRTQCLNLPGTVIGPAQCLSGYNTYATYIDEEPQYRIRTPEEQLQYKLDRTERDAIDACRYAFNILNRSFKSTQDLEIAKYSVKGETELMTQYDIWVQNKIKKGELPMNTYDVAYNEKKAAAQKAYDEALVAARKEKEEAAQKEANDIAAKTLKGMYDAYVNAGFTPEQAEKFVTIALEKVAGKI